MTERRADRNRRKREQNRTRYDTPREDAAPTVAQRRLQLAANICRLPATMLPASTASQIWDIRHELLVALDAAGVRADATAPLSVYVIRFFGFDQPPETAEAIAQDLGLGTTTVWNNLQRAYDVMRAWLAAERPSLLSEAQPDATSTDPLFWSKVQRSPDPDGCWSWTGATDLGYGVVKRGGKKLQAHRYAYTLTYGPLTEGLHLIHRCRNRLCVNPAHLQEVAPGKG
jgi:hypothetical protein